MTTCLEIKVNATVAKAQKHFKANGIKKRTVFLKFKLHVVKE